MTPREKVEIALHGGYPGTIPFTIYEQKLEPCSLERELRNRGLCIVQRRVPVFNTIRPNVKVTQNVYFEDDKRFVRTYYDTPEGVLTTLEETNSFTSWVHEKMFKSADDYRKIRYLVQDETYQPCYEVFQKAQERAGDDVIFRAGLGLEPLQTFVSSLFMDMQQFCLEWMDSRDEILSIVKLIGEKRRLSNDLVAKSPALHANYGGNVTVSIIGKEAFTQYYVPYYDEAADLMHKHGKLIGVHFDGNNRLIAADIAKSKLDYIEAFTPPPDTDMTLLEARQAWPDKVLWLNYPSSWHLLSDAAIEEKMPTLFEGITSFDGIIMGITEDMPYDRHLYSCKAIMNGLDQLAKNKQN
ncbi:MAG: hypothetical protein WC071_09120 [Victivallaceae bacterium]